MNWIVECPELEKIKNKVYEASYNLKTKEFDGN